MGTGFRSAKRMRRTFQRQRFVSASGYRARFRAQDRGVAPVRDIPD
jgi:transcriptional regulator GlxA family with amidase domain